MNCARLGATKPIMECDMLRESVAGLIRDWTYPRTYLAGSKVREAFLKSPRLLTASVKDPFEFS